MGGWRGDFRRTWARWGYTDGSESYIATPDAGPRWLAKTYLTRRLFGVWALAQLPQPKPLCNFFGPFRKSANRETKGASFCFHHAVDAAVFRSFEKPM